MAPCLFIIFTFLACIMAAVAFLPFSKSKLCWRKKLIIGATASLIPIIAKVTFSIFPLFEARVMPVEGYPLIQNEFWLPFAVLFFAFVSQLVPCKSRRAVLIIVIILVLVVIHQNFWHLEKPAIYNYKGKITNGVCQQTSFDTCGAASMVTLLNKIGVQTSEGEMAGLALTVPGKGLSPHQAAYGLRKKLSQVGRTETAFIKVFT